MSPASQGNLEVERYIGSCLISSSVRVNSNNGNKNSSGNHVNKGKKVTDGGGSRVGKLQTGVLHHRTNCVNGNGGNAGNDHPYNHVGSGSYTSPNGLLPLCECGGLKFGGARYGSHGTGAGVGGSWAGLPLISMAPSNSRRNRKPTSPSTGSVNGVNRNPKNPSTGPQAIAIVAGANCIKSATLDVDHGSQQSRTPLSRLAIHTQGAPLILAGRYSINGRKNNGSQSKGPPARQFRGGDITVRRSNSVRETRDTSGTSNGTSGTNGGTPNSDCLSVASDESSGHSENSLPRIIKPRKRRKKDRKPPPPPANTSPDTSSSSAPGELKDSPGIVTLKPYVPLCYELYDNGRWNGSRRSLTKEDTEERIKVWGAESKHTFALPSRTDVQGDEQVSQTSEEDNQEPKLHHNFDDVEENEDSLHVDTTALFPYPCPTTVCQCRYCDPSGLIWDVDQHCYSPFLTPPSPTEDIKSPSFSKSPFANIPLFLTPPHADVRSFDFFSRDTRSTPSPSALHPENDRNSILLRRSWSEPLPSNLGGNEQESRGNFGVIGRGRIYDGDTATESREANRRTVPDVAAEVSSNSSSLMSSQSLEVSTEIVTSPNGHRDIEIKFYSSSPPIGAALVSNGEVKKVQDASGCDEGGLRNVQVSVASSQEVAKSQEFGSAEVGKKESEESLCVESGKAKEEGCVNSKQDASQSDSGMAVWVGIGKTSGCGVRDHSFCEQSAKTLGEEVNQLHLHTEA